MKVTAKADYAVRAAVELAAAAGHGPVKAERIAHAQRIPVNFLENILAELKRAGIVESRRGAAGGYLLARPADEISLADVIRAVEGPLASVRGNCCTGISTGVASRLLATSVRMETTLWKHGVERIPPFHQFEYVS